MSVYRYTEVNRASRSEIVQAMSEADAQPSGATRCRRLLVTGAAGRIGSAVVPRLAAEHDLRLAVAPGEDATAIAGHGQIVSCDLLDLPALKAACENIDTIVHLAADPSPAATWARLCDTNITGTYHCYAAAIAAGCRRVVYASSIHAVSGHPAGRQVRHDDPVNPGDLYGVSKCFGEALARYAATQHDLSSICIRIGAFQPPERSAEGGSLGLMDAFLSDRDCAQLISLAVADEQIRFAIVHGLSGNRFNRLDLSRTEELLGYRPQDDLTELDPDLRPLDLAERVQPHDQRHHHTPSGMREELDPPPG